MKILGIDPGSTSMGFGVIEATNSSLKKIASGTTNLKQKDLAEKLSALRGEVKQILAEHSPDAVGIEKLFFAKNKKTAFEVAQARGVILVTLYESGVPIFEFTPAEIKIAATNYGSADKLMVRKMVQRLLALKEMSGDDNAADALAVAITTAGKVRWSNL
jgi:crossover junction endodeoxyribonuclease RuvC